MINYRSVSNTARHDRKSQPFLSSIGDDDVGALLVGERKRAKTRRAAARMTDEESMEGEERDGMKVGKE